MHKKTVGLVVIAILLTLSAGLIVSKKDGHPDSESRPITTENEEAGEFTPTTQPSVDLVQEPELTTPLPTPTSSLPTHTPTRVTSVTPTLTASPTSSPTLTFPPTISPTESAIAHIPSLSPTAAQAVPVVSPIPVTAEPNPVQPTSPPPPPPPPSGNSGQRLIIPAINVNAPIVLVGLDPNGSMAAPAGWHDVGWYRYGPRPGYPGSAALAGHLDTNTGAPGAFWSLDQLGPGDTIIYQSSNGSQLTFIVSETAFYPWDQVPLDRVFARSGEPRIALITCGGQWSRDNRNYSHRTIVYAQLQQ